MLTYLSAIFLLVGASICLLASVGVLVLPDFFMRMHAATKTGVAGSGLMLIGVGFAVQSPGMWIKVAIAVTFLLLTMPIAAHLLARAGYVAGVPMWSGTQSDELTNTLQRGSFERSSFAAADRNIRNVVLGLAHGEGLEEAIEHAVELARSHDVELTGLAILDTKTLGRVGPMPIGGSYWAMQAREARIGTARKRMAESIESFAAAARAAGVPIGVVVEEGSPAPILRHRLDDGTVLVLPRRAWFDHGVAAPETDTLSRLARHGMAGAPHPGPSRGEAPVVVTG